MAGRTGTGERRERGRRGAGERQERGRRGAGEGRERGGRGAREGQERARKIHEKTCGDVEAEGSAAGGARGGELVARG